MAFAFGVHNASLKTRAWVLSLLVLAGCGSTAPSTSTAITSSPGPTSSSTSSSVTTSSTSSSTLPIASTTISPAAASTSRAPVRRVVLAPGDVFVLDDRLVDNPYFRSTDAQTVLLDAWFVAVDPPTESFRQHSALLGQATVFRDGRVRLESTVPSVIAVRTLKFGAAVVRPTAAGEYRIEGIPGVSLQVQVNRDAPPLDLPVARPAPVPAQRQVLGENDLAGVEFGTRDDDAEERLVARFGAPTGRKDWQNGCVGQYRWMWWGGLVVEFRRDAPGGNGRLASYRYGRPDWWFGGAEVEVASVIGLGTHDGVVLGASVALLRGITDRAEFRSGYDGFVVDRWLIPGSGIVATLDTDFLRPDARVARISAPAETALSVC